ncbi:MAG: pilus assembly protein [Marmoricola sp.]|nr:pilus assembly protein [Marmoricola sp.]
MEFALISTLLITLVFGIIQYGLFFNDSLSLRQGVREGARMGVVRTFAADAPCTATSTDMEKLRCSTKVQIGGSAADTYVKVVRPVVWAKTQPLIVCAVMRSTGSFGVLPMPNSGYVAASTQMSVEQDVPVPTGTSVADALPSGVVYPC